MFNSTLLAGFFWATTHFMPMSTVVAPPVAAPLASAPTFAAALASAPVGLTQTQTIQPQMALKFEIPAATVTTDDDLQADAQEFVARINSERTAQGVGTLTADPMLAQTARAHSEEMASHAYFDHRSPTSGLTTPMDRYLSSLKEWGGSQPDYLLVGENIYYCSVSNDIYNVEYAHRALMDSPGHRANILEPRFTKVGIGLYRNARGEFWVTEMFSRDTNP